MLIRHLDYFVTLAEERHFGRAAELCGVSQPALSLAIRKLEEDLGSLLIVRGQRFMGLTAEGEKVLARGRRILADYGNLRDELSGRRKGGLTGRLRLGAVASAMPRLPEVSTLFEARNPMARIAISLLAPEDLRKAVADLSLDAGLTWLEQGDQPAARKGNPRNRGAATEAIPLWRERPLFACRRDHPFAPGPLEPAPAIPWSEATTQPLCLGEDLIGGPMAVGGIRPAVTCSSLDGVLAHLRSGLWCAIVPEGFRNLLAGSDDILLLELRDPEARGSGGPSSGDPSSRDPGETVEPRLGLVMAGRAPRSPMALALRDCVEALREAPATEPPSEA
ncbi:LysR family transcriptional regulator [Pseudogemmobacter sonorensis]|uniref:LysR family transcriptional regulator n=1 Tax=Pseudogemmobacter sonorensis TaxID=2989681 RepID=UPI00368B2694